MDEVKNTTVFSALTYQNGNFSTNEYILLEEYEETEYICVLIDSPFGQAVLDKQIGESFAYQIEEQNVTGIIEDIIKIKEKIK